MHDVLEMIYEYRLLLSKRERLEIPLDDAETARLVALSGLLRGEVAGPRDARRAMPRLPCPGTVEFTLPGGFGLGEVRNVSGGGIAIATAPLPGGLERTIVRIARPAQNVEYVFPCRILWSASAGGAGIGPTLVGMAFDGVPSVTHYVGDSGVWRNNFHLSSGRKTPISA